MELWARYQEINEELKKDFLCIPPYQCVSGKFVGELYKTLQENDTKTLRSKIVGAVNLPYQRTYQMEYRYKHCDILKPFMPVIEYATYDAMKGNWMCAYLSLLPVIEATIRQWYEEVPNLSFSGMKKATELYQNQQMFSDDRQAITDGYVDYLKYILEDTLFIRFDDYAKKGYADTFNRNLSLHKLSGVIEMSEGLRNLTRLQLVLDILAELYLMQTPTAYWQLTFYATPDKNTNFLLRWELYKKWAMQSLGPDDLLVIHNCFIENDIADDTKQKFINTLKHEIDRIQKR